MSKQLLVLRMNILSIKNEFIKTSIHSKFYIDFWQTNCISAEATEKDLEMIASDNETFTKCVHTFDFICLKCL